MNKRIVAFIVTFIAGASLALQPCLAQITSGQISGRVVDPNGHPIAEAQVTLVNRLNAGQRSAATDGEGAFVFASVQPGIYDISVTASGFKNFSKRDIVLNASDQLSAGTLQMQIGTATQSVSVQADVTPVQTESGERSALLEQKQLQSLLDPARNFLNLTRVLPGVVATGTVGQDQLGIYGMDTVNGQRSEYSTVSMDGVPGNVNNNSINQVQTPLNTDAISQVKILSNNYQAEDGGSSGSSINAITKAGTQDFHGTVYYYKRHEEFNANDYFNSAYWNGTEQPKGINRFNTIGYNIGGPVLIPKTGFNRNRDKLFFFFSQEIGPRFIPVTAILSGSESPPPRSGKASFPPRSPTRRRPRRDWSARRPTTPGVFPTTPSRHHASTRTCRS